MNKSFAPHLRSPRTTRGIMLDVCLALLPALGAAVWRFGTRALAVTAVSAISCVGFEALMRIILKRKQTIGDLSAVVTGLLLAFNLPATLPLWMIPIGALAAIVVVKELFGGIGQNFANPAITARIVLMLSFPVQMTAWNLPSGHSWGADAIASATPLQVLSVDAVASATSMASATPASAAEALPSLMDMFLGNRAGSLGEICALALLLGFVYLCIFRVIVPIVPLCFAGTVAVFSLFAGHFDLSFVGYQVLSGGLLLGAVFMATDYTTTPVSMKGKLVFGIGCGLITCLIRFYGGMPEGVSFAILLMNLLVPHIEKLCAPKPFGKERSHGRKQKA